MSSTRVDWAAEINNIMEVPKSSHCLVKPDSELGKILKMNEKHLFGKPLELLSTDMPYYVASSSIVRDTLAKWSEELNERERRAEAKVLDTNLSLWTGGKIPSQMLAGFDNFVVTRDQLQVLIARLELSENDSRAREARIARERDAERSAESIELINNILKQQDEAKDEAVAAAIAAAPEVDVAAAGDNDDDDAAEAAELVDMMCAVCMVNRKTCMLKPCGHLCVCPACFEQLRRLNQPCPMCRGRIDGTNEVFY